MKVFADLSSSTCFMLGFSLLPVGKTLGFFLAPLDNDYSDVNGTSPSLSFEQGDTSTRRLSNHSCGSLQCLNKGLCLDGHSYSSNEPFAVCDCTPAVEILSGGPPYQFMRWVGKECEIEVQPEDYCTGPNRFLFCVNNGTCRSEAPNFQDVPCECDEGFSGRHCEYTSAPACSLTCNGRGKCQHGVNPIGEKGPNQALNLPGKGTIDYQHCVCDPGYAGAECEYKYIKCAGDNKQKFCYHGSTCGVNGTDVCRCHNDEGLQLTGAFCEFRATNRCDDPILISATTLVTEGFSVANKLISHNSSAEAPYCVNDGICYKVHNTSDYYCKCVPKGNLTYTGKRCESVIKPSSITTAPTVTATLTAPPTVQASATYLPTAAPVPINATAPVKCGNLTCQNGGQCASGHNYSVAHAVCDCSMAENAQTKYVGRTCEIAVSKSSFCLRGVGQYCINGGTCRGKADDYAQTPCACPVGFKGRHCEFAIQHVKSNCTLACNSGKCEHGINPNHQKGANSLLGLNNSGSEDFMHCACLDGFAGTKCEYKAIKCEGRKRYCFHGAKCAPAGSPNVCDCTSTEKKLDGAHCEFEATDHCSSPVPIAAAAAVLKFGANKTLDVDAANPPFCVNDGICYQVSDDTMRGYICDCDETRWTGKKCGIPVKHASHTPAPTAAVTDTYAPTEEASNTGQPVPTMAPTKHPHHFVSPPATPERSPITQRPSMPSVTSMPGSGGTSEVQNADASNDDGISGGGKFGIVIFVLVGAAVLGVVGVAYYRRRASWIQKSNTYPTGDAPDYSDKQMDMAPFEEGDEREMDITGDTTSDVDISADSATAPTSNLPAGEEEKTMKNVNIV